MKTNKTLRNIVLASALALGSTGCGVDQSRYNYDGKIGEDNVIFKDGNFPSLTDNNVLTVTKPDGRFISYVTSFGGDLTLRYVLIKKNDHTTQYTRHNDVGKLVLDEAQKQFDKYLKIILRIKQQDSDRVKQEQQMLKQEEINEALEDLK
nr:hypothetical protein [Candidatus Woesearchaeota archaeon]